MVTHNCSAKLWYIVFKINQVFALLVRDHIIKVDVFVAPFKVVDYAFVCQLLLHDEEVLEKLYYSFIDVKVIELSDHCFLIL